MLIAGRIDEIARNSAPIASQIKPNGFQISEPAVIANKTSKITVSIAPGTVGGDAIVAQIVKLVEGMIATSEIQDIIESYMPDAVQPR